MKRSVIIIGITMAVATFGATAFGFINKQQDDKTGKVKKRAVTSDQSLAATNYIGIDLFQNMKVSDNQNLFYTVGRKYNRSITLRKLSKAQFISDVIEDYPSSWITDYNSVEISTTLNGKEMKATSSDASLTKEQKQIFNLASDFVINVNYQKENYNSNVENRQMNVSMTVVPEVEAEFTGGYDQMITYLKENSLDKIFAKKLNYTPQPSISFIVNENGKTENIKLKKTSGDVEIDKLLVELIQKMPIWKPAENSKGLKVKQQFEFNVGMNGC